MARNLENIAAVVMAAGQSKRMGTPKMALPWGRTTVIQQVVDVLRESGIQEIVAVTGGAGPKVEQLLSGAPVHVVRNEQFEHTEMLRSFQMGIGWLPTSVQATLVVLGDQPQIETEVVKEVCNSYLEDAGEIVVPSYRMRRGHPWLVDRKLWPEILSLKEAQSLRGFLNQHAQEIHYVVTNHASILADLDTPEDYRQQQPN